MGTPLRRQSRRETRGQLEILKPEAAGRLRFAVDPDETRRLAGSKGHVEPVEGPAEPVAGGLDESLLPRPAAEERAGSLGLGHGPQVGALPGGEEPLGDRVRLRDRALPLDVYPELSVRGKGEQCEPA